MYVSAGGRIPSTRIHVTELIQFSLFIAKINNEINIIENIVLAAIYWATASLRPMTTSESLCLRPCLVSSCSHVWNCMSSSSSSTAKFRFCQRSRCSSQTFAAPGHRD